MKRFLFFIVLLFAVGSFMGCGARWVRTPLVDQKNITVGLEHEIVKKQVVKHNYDHPCDIDPQVLAGLLRQLKYLAEPMIYGNPEEKPVFQEVEIERLAPALAEALARADPDQRVRFISRNRGGGLLFKKDRKTDGVVFVEKGRRLNVAFSNVNYEILTSQMNNLSQRDEYTDPLKIKSSFTPIVAPDYAGHPLTKKGEPFPLWVAVDIDKITMSAAPQSESATGKTGPTDQPAGEAGPGNTKLSNTVSQNPAAKKPEPSWETRKQENTKKLQYLKELYESGLINENEYKEQKEKLLNQL